MHNFLSIPFFIIVVALAASTGCTSQESEPAASGDTMEGEPGFESIFNGEDLTGWDGDPRFWSVENEVIVGETTAEEPTEETTYLVWEGEPVSDFEATFQYRFVEVGEELSGNSGFQYRSEQYTEPGNPALRWRVRGHQADFAVSDWIPGIHYEQNGRSVMVRRGQRVVVDSANESTIENFATEDSLQQYIHHTEWNDMRVYANGDTMRSYIKGQLMHELIDHGSDPVSLEEGIIALQLHAGDPMRIEIRDIQLKRFE